MQVTKETQIVDDEKEYTQKEEVNTEMFVQQEKGVTIVTLNKYLKEQRRRAKEFQHRKTIMLECLEC